ncbi:MAG: TonB-dependent receptor [Sphingobium sp.]|nr:TonB-dependent receptor [Sphingobium sp.]
MIQKSGAQARLFGVSLLAFTSLTAASVAHADDAPPIAGNDLAEGSAIVVTGTKANEIAPVTASLQATQPQAVISRSFIEDSLPATADFNQIALISPSVSNFGGVNGPGLSESKAQIRGFQDGEYNVTYDGVPFGDTNDPTHHSNTFFPSNTIETLVIDRGPGNASQLGQATFGGNINMFSRTTREDASVEGKLSYGSWNSWMARALIQTGAIKALGGTEIVISGQHIETDGARTYSPFHSSNIFGKAVIPLGPDVKLSILGTYNQNHFNQPDKDGATLSQVALYGKHFSLNNDPSSQTYFGYNYTNKTTDFEIAKLEVVLSPMISFDDKLYTYSYDNETLSGSDVTLYATATPSAIATANMVKLTQDGASVAGIPGYTKTNKYRVWGNIAQVHWNFGIATLTAGIWVDFADTYRQQRDVELVTMAPNFAEKKVKDPVTQALTPSNIKFDQNSNTDHNEEFAELEIRPTDQLKITPGIKFVSFKRSINAAYNQTTRYPQQVSNTYTATLPFVTVNYAATENVSFYAQFAKGFLAPALGVLYVDKPGLSTVEPERSTNYQFGGVYHGASLSIDADVYVITFNNKFKSAPAPNQADGTIWFNQGAVTYKGVEGQITYAFDNGLAVFANASRNYAKTNNPGVAHMQVANAPEYTVATGILYKRGPIRFSLTNKYTGRQWAVEGQDDNYRIPGYDSANASLRYEFGKFRVGVEVENIFGTTSVTNINQGKTKAFDQYFYQPGRSVTADVTVKF